MQTLFGFELSTGLRWIIAFAIVLVLVALFAFLLRRITGGRLKFKGQGSGRTRQPRLGVVDIHDLDRQRQLILVRRDNVEHLVMIGGASDVVIETNIMRSGARVAAPLPSEGAPERPLALEPLTLPELPLRGESAEEPRRAPPLPEPVPPPMPAPPAPPLRQQPTMPPARPAGQAMPPARPAPLPAATPAAAAAAVAATALGARETVAAGQAELGDMARQLEEALKRPFSAVRPSGGARPETEAVKPPAAPVSPVAPPVPANEPKPPPTLSGGIPASSRPPLDMEAELEMALGLKPGPARPAEAPMVVPPVFAAPERKPQPVPAKSEPAKPEPARPEPTRPEPARLAPTGPAPTRPEPARSETAEKGPETAAKPREAPVPSFEAALGAEPKRDEPKPVAPKPVAPKPAEPPAEPKSPEAKPDRPKAEQPGSDEAKQAETKQAEAGSAEAKPAEAKPAEAKPAEPKPAEPKPSEADPFSVDAIEAEFARLLGRDPKPKG